MIVFKANETWNYDTGKYSCRSYLSGVKHELFHNQYRITYDIAKIIKSPSFFCNEEEEQQIKTAYGISETEARTLIWCLNECVAKMLNIELRKVLSGNFLQYDQNFKIKEVGREYIFSFKITGRVMEVMLYDRQSEFKNQRY